MLAFRSLLLPKSGILRQRGMKQHYGNTLWIFRNNGKSSDGGNAHLIKTPGRNTSPFLMLFKMLP